MVFRIVPFSWVGVFGVIRRRWAVFITKCLGWGLNCPENRIEMRQFQSKPSGSVPQGKTGSMRLIYRGILPAVLGLYKGRPRGVRAERFEGVIGGSPVPHCRPGPPIVRFRGD